MYTTRRKVYNYQKGYLPLLKKHLAQGYSFGSFQGKYNIAYTAWLAWKRDIPEVKELNDDYKLKQIDKKRFKHPSLQLTTLACDTSINKNEV